MRNLFVIMLLASFLKLDAQEKLNVKKTYHCNITTQWTDHTDGSILYTYCTVFSVKEDTTYPYYVLKVVKQKQRNDTSYFPIIKIMLLPQKTTPFPVYFYFCNSLFPYSTQGGGTIEDQDDGSIYSYDNSNTAFSMKQQTNSVYFIPLVRVHEGLTSITTENYVFEKPKK